VTNVFEAKKNSQVIRLLPFTAPSNGLDNSQGHFKILSTLSESNKFENTKNVRVQLNIENESKVD
jgi:hypothetical protein